MCVCTHQPYRLTCCVFRVKSIRKRKKMLVMTVSVVFMVNYNLIHCVWGLWTSAFGGIRMPPPARGFRIHSSTLVGIAEKDSRHFGFVWSRYQLRFLQMGLDICLLSRRMESSGFLRPGIGTLA